MVRKLTQLIYPEHKKNIIEEIVRKCTLGFEAEIEEQKPAMHLKITHPLYISMYA